MAFDLWVWVTDWPVSKHSWPLCSLQPTKMLSQLATTVLGNVLSWLGDHIQQVPSPALRILTQGPPSEAWGSRGVCSASAKSLSHGTPATCSSGTHPEVTREQYLYMFLNHFKNIIYYIFTDFGWWFVCLFISDASALNIWSYIVLHAEQKANPGYESKSQFSSFQHLITSHSCVCRA